MNILFTRFPLESRFGGAEVQVLSLMEGLKERGYEVSFLGDCPVLLEECEKRAIGYWQLAIGSPPVTKWNACNFLWRQFAMKKKLESQLLTTTSQLPDVVIMLSLTEKILLTPLLLKKGVKVLWLEHDRVGRWLQKNPWLRKLRKLSKHVTTVVVSDLSKQMYMDLGWNEKDITVIANGIDPTRLQGKANYQKPIVKSLHVGSISRLTHDKGLDVLIDAVANLPDTSLTIVGTGRDEKDIRQHAKSQLPKANCQIIDFIPNLTSFYNSLDVLVLPSREHDPFGLVAAEAMLLGTPVVVTDVCGIADYLENGHDALMVPADDTPALQAALETLQDSAVRAAIGKAGQKTAEEKFTVERMVEEYIGIL